MNESADARSFPGLVSDMEEIKDHIVMALDKGFAACEYLGCSALTGIIEDCLSNIADTCRRIDLLDEEAGEIFSVFVWTLVMST